MRWWWTGAEPRIPLPDHGSSHGTERLATWQPPDLRTVAALGGPDRPASGPTREEAAYALGWDEGRSALMTTGELQLAEAARACKAAGDAMRQAVELLQSRFTETVNLMAVGIAWHLVGREFTVEPGHLQELVARALVLAPLNGPLTVRLHPLDLEALQSLPGALPSAPAALEISWVADPAVHRSGCLLEASAAVVDGRIDRALLDIHERLAHG